MASELEQRMAFEEETKNLIGIPECLVHRERGVVLHGGGSVDNPDAISMELTGYVGLKAHCLLLHLREEGDVRKRRGYGQCGFIRKDKIQTSPGGTTDYSVMPVTAKHNLRCLYDGKCHAVQAEVLVDQIHSIDFGSNDLDWIPSPTDAVLLRCDEKDRLRAATWAFGVDISIGNLIERPTPGITNEHCSFELVRDNFYLEVGQKVGMAVLFSPQAKPTRKTVASVGFEEFVVSDMDLERIYGQPNTVNIYTGEITYVGDEHIEFDINTFTGCSGAVIFLLDQGQPASVQSCDFGKAIAVHAGAHPFLVNRNLGFKLRKVFE
jgi:hypothetical protein